MSEYKISIIIKLSNKDEYIEVLRTLQSAITSVNNRILDKSIVIRTSFDDGKDDE